MAGDAKAEPRWPSLLIGFSLGGCIAIFLLYWYCSPLYFHSRWGGRVQDDIHMLTHKRPPGVTKGQWEFTVGWTINLHGNCGSIMETVEPAWRDRFATELERRLQGPITLGDVEWIWDEYVSHTKYGRHYSDLWRPTRSESFQEAHEGVFGIPVD